MEGIQRQPDPALEVERMQKQLEEMERQTQQQQLDNFRGVAPDNEVQPPSAISQGAGMPSEGGPGAREVDFVDAPAALSFSQVPDRRVTQSEVAVISGADLGEHSHPLADWQLEAPDRQNPEALSRSQQFDAGLESAGAVPHTALLNGKRDLR